MGISPTVSSKKKKKRKEKELANLPNKTRKLKAAMMIYAAWNIWKARNSRVFNQQLGSAITVMQEIKGEIIDRRMACGGHELASAAFTLNLRTTLFM